MEHLLRKAGKKNMIGKENRKNLLLRNKMYITVDKIQNKNFI